MPTVQDCMHWGAHRDWKAKRPTDCTSPAGLPIQEMPQHVSGTTPHTCPLSPSIYTIGLERSQESRQHVTIMNLYSQHYRNWLSKTVEKAARYSYPWRYFEQTTILSCLRIVQGGTWTNWQESPCSDQGAPWDVHPPLEIHTLPQAETNAQVVSAYQSHCKTRKQHLQIAKYHTMNSTLSTNAFASYVMVIRQISSTKRQQDCQQRMLTWG